MTGLSDGSLDSDDARLWADAATLGAIGDLMARWLEGDISHQPGYGGTGRDDETDDLVPLLAAVNRAGYVTTFSQPGEVGDGWHQRAAVEGFCDEEIATRIYDAVLETEVIPLVWQPGAVGECHPIPVTREGDRQNTWVGYPMDSENIDHWYGPALPPAGVAALHRAFQVVLIDPQWGRNDHLWPTLGAALGVGWAGGPVGGIRAGALSREQVIRVAIVAPDGRSSGTWRIWVEREDVYVAPRHDAGLYKVSLHRHGWRWAYTAQHPRGPGDVLPEGHDRCLYRFDKPPFIDGAQFAFAIGILPHGLLVLPPDNEATSLPTPAGDGWRKVLRVYVTEPGLVDTDLNLAFAYEVVAPSPLRLHSGRGVWVLATDEEWPPEGSRPEPLVGAAVKFVNFGGGGANDAPGLVQVGVRLSDT